MEAANREDLAGLLHLIDELQKMNKAQRKRIAFLEKRLAQRFESTKQDYASRVKFFESMQDRVLQLFLEDVPAGVGLSMSEVLEELARKFPAIKSANWDRRVQELAKAGKLWACKDDDGTVRFYLRLLENDKSAEIGTSSPKCPPPETTAYKTHSWTPKSPQKRPLSILRTLETKSLSSQEPFIYSVHQQRTREVIKNGKP